MHVLYGNVDVVIHSSSHVYCISHVCSWFIVCSTDDLYRRIKETIKYSVFCILYVRRWIGSALLQITVCRLFRTKPLSGETFRYSQELSHGPLVYRNKLQWNFNQNRKLFIHGNASEYIVCELAAILSRGGVGGGGRGGGVGVGVGGDGLTERELSMLSDHRNALSILMFGLIITMTSQWTR